MHLEVNHAHAYARSVRTRTCHQRRSGWHRRPEDRENSKGDKLEAPYFSEQKGRLGGTFVVNVKGLSAIPVLAEPWLLTFHAEGEFRIAMTPEDLARTRPEESGKKWA